MFSILWVVSFLRISLGGLENKEIKRPRPIRTNITIGAILPLNSGGLAKYAQEEIRAAKVAAAMINEDDDYLVRVNIISEPSGMNDSSEAADAARKLADAGVDAIVGALRSSRSKTIMAVAEDRGLAQVSHGSGSNELKNSEEHPNFFRVIPNDDYQAQALMDVLAIIGVRKVGMIRTNDLYANGIAMKFKELWKEAGFDFSPPFDSPELEYEMNKVDAVKAIDFLKSQGTAATNIICVGSDSDNGKLIDEIKAQEIDGRGYLWAGFDLFASDFDKAIEGSIGTQIKLARVNPFYQSMLAKWEDMFSDDMPSDAGELPYTAQMFDAVAVIAQAATDAIDAGYEANKTSILRVLQKGKVATPGIGNTDAEGDVTIDDSGNGPKTYEIMNFVGDRWFDVGDWGDEATPKYLPETDFTFAGMEDFYLGDERPSEEQGESAMEIREPLEENGLITPLENLETESDESTDDAQESSDDRPRDSKERVRRYLGTNDENRNQTIEKIPELESTKATTEYETTEEALESSTTAKGGPNVNPVTTEEAKEADTTKRVPKTETTEKAPKSETAEPATQSETTEVPESEMTEKALDSNTTIKDEGNVNPALSPLVTEESQKNESSVQSQKENQATTTDTDEKISPVINTTDASGRSLSIGKMVDHVLELEF